MRVVTQGLVGSFIPPHGCGDHSMSDCSRGVSEGAGGVLWKYCGGTVLGE